METIDLENRPKINTKNESSLKNLLKKHNIIWPFDNIILKDLKETKTGEELTFNATINTKELPFGDSITDELSSIIKMKQIDIKICIDANNNTDQWTVTITSNFNTIQIDTGGNTTLSIKNSLLVLKIDESTSSIDCKITGNIPFKIEGNSLDLNAFIILDTKEIVIGGTLDGSKSLFTIPSVLDGFEIDSLGLSVGINYSSPSLDIVLSGKFQWGEENKNTDSDKNNITISCEEIDSVFITNYFSFHIAKLSIDKLFNKLLKTNISKPTFDFENLNFSWIIPDSQPTLPNGQKPANEVLNFSSYLDICGLKFYGKIDIQDKSNFSGEFSIPEIKLGKVFSLKGDKGDRPEYSCKVVDNSPQFNLNAQATLLDLASTGIYTKNDQLTFDIETKKIIDTTINGSLICNNNSCKLDVDFKYGIDKSINLPKIDGYNLGHIDLDSTIDVSFNGENKDNEDFSLDLSVKLQFEGNEIGPIQFISKSSTLKNIIDEIENEIESDIFKLFDDATKWIDGVVKGIIKGIDKDAKELAKILHKAFGKDLKTTIAFLKDHFAYCEKDIIKALHDIGCDAYKVAHEIKKEFDTDADKVAKYINEAYNITAMELAKELKKALYDLDDTAKAIKYAYNADARLTMKALKEGYEASLEEITKALKEANYIADDIAIAIKDVYDLDAKEISKELKKALYDIDDAAKAIKAAFRHKVKIAGKALKEVYDASRHDLKKALEYAKYTEDEIEKVLGYLYIAETNPLPPSYH